MDYSRTLFSITVFIFLISGEAFSQFAGGKGTAIEPFQITSLKQLQEIKNYPSSHFIQTTDIDASATENWNDGKGFQPIGTDSIPFTGTFNGNNFIINGLTIHRESEEYTGLFGFINGAVIKRVTLTNASVSGSNNTGVLAGFAINGYLSDNFTQGEISGRTHVGGLIGYNYGEITESKSTASVSGYSYVGGLAGFNRGEIIKSNAKGKVSGTGNGVGGLVGNNYDGSIKNSYAQSTVSGTRATSFGGLVGSNGGFISGSYAKGEVNGRSYVGGLVGFNRGEISDSYTSVGVSGAKNGIGGLVGNNYGGKISWTYARGNVSGDTQVGGLIGVNKNNGSVIESYSSSLVSGRRHTGGFIGVNSQADLNGYWDMESSDQINGVGSGPTEGVTGLRTHEMTGAESEENMTDFAFRTKWGAMPDEYPQLLAHIPYYTLTNIETQDFIISGQSLNFGVSIKNIGGIPDTNTVALRDNNGAIIDTVQNLALNTGEEIDLIFEWHSTTQDKGQYELAFETQHERTSIQVDVRNIPSKVEITLPKNVQEHVPLKPEFQWKEAELAERYQLQIAKDEKFSSVVFNFDEIDTTYFKLNKTLEHHQDYLWRVRGKNPDENGEWSNVFNFTTIIEKPETVVLLEPMDESEAVDTAPVLRWSASERAAEYLVQLSKDDEFEELMFDTTFTAPDTTFKFEKNLEQQTLVFWRMQASNAGGESDWSEVYSFTTSESVSTEDDFIPMDFSLEQNYPNPFNGTTNIRYGIPEATNVRLEVLNMLGQTVATLVNERKSPGWHTATFDASDLSSGFYLYRIKAKSFENTKKLMLIK